MKYILKRESLDFKQSAWYNKGNMKISKILDENIKEGNSYAGLSQFTNRTSGGALTLEMLEKQIKYMTSKEYQEKEMKKMQAIAMGQIIAQQAYNQGLINDSELIQILGSIGINQGLVVSPRIAKKLRKVKLPKRIKNE